MFTIPPSPDTRHYYFPWYDFSGMQSWVLMANPPGSGSDLAFDLSIGTQKKDLTAFALQGASCPAGQCTAGQVPQGMTLTPSFPGVLNGPVKVSSLTGDKAIVSQRSLMGSSFEEVPATEAERRSSHFYWTWYDQKSPGMADWVMIANPDAEPVYYEVTIAGQDPGPGSKGVIEPGKSAWPTFPGQIGGPVEVKAFKANPDGTPRAEEAQVIASQRVLSGYGSAFNEMPGIPAEELSDHYLWTWYDSVGSGGQNWIMLANPSDTEVSFDITIAGQTPAADASGTIAPGGIEYRVFPGKTAGPVEVTASADIIASQRIVWGPSFGEVAGYPYDSLASSYHWTWYDMQSPGSSNWVMIANPGEDDVYYEVTIAGTNPGPGSKGTIEAGKSAWPTFPGRMAGPVEVKAFKVNPDGTPTTTPAQVMASQRVVWNGHFNEVAGVVLDMNTTPQDTTSPFFFNISPTGTINQANPSIEADITDSDSGVNGASISVALTGPSGPVALGSCSLTDIPNGKHISCPATGLAGGAYSIAVTAQDNAGNTGTGTGGFNAAVPAAGIHKLTDNLNDDDTYPQINAAGQVVWNVIDGMGADREIYLYTPGLGTEKLTDNNYDDEQYQINDSGQVVWMGHDGNDYEIYLYTPGAGTSRLTDNGSYDNGPKINASGQVVWYGLDGSEFDIYMHTPGAGTAKLTDNAGNDTLPEINDFGQVVWMSYAGTGFDPNTFEIYLHTPGAGTAKLTDSVFYNVWPKINDSGQVVWLGHDGSDYEVYSFTPGIGTAKLTDTTYSEYFLQINSAGQVVWNSGERFGGGIYLYTPGAGTVQLTNDDKRYSLPQINDSGQVVWRSSNNSIYLYTPGAGTAVLATDTWSDNAPFINASGQVVWHGDDGDRSETEIFLFIP